MPPEPPFSKISISVGGSLAKDYVLIPTGPLVAIFLSSCRPSSLLVRSRMSGSYAGGDVARPDADGAGVPSRCHTHR